MRTYEDFELWISADGGDGYRVWATGVGEKQRVSLDAASLTDRWARLASALSGNHRATSEEIKDAETLGGDLFRATFGGGVLFAWGAAMARADARSGGVRIVLHVQEAGPLASLPWELLFEGQNRGFLAISPKTPIVRSADVQERPRQLAKPPPLRVLGVLAEPLGQPLLDLDGEWREIERATAPGLGRMQIEIQRLESPTFPELRNRLKGEPVVHAIHFAGHGISGALDLVREGRIRWPEPALGRQLATLVDDAPELRLVVINACEGAVGFEGEVTMSVAFHFAQRGLPAVVALQSAVSDTSARMFSKKLYRELAQGTPIDLAVTEARKALHDHHLGLAWAAPVLYLRGPSGDLFELPDLRKENQPISTSGISAIHLVDLPKDQPSRKRFRRWIGLGGALIGITSLLMVTYLSSRCPDPPPEPKPPVESDPRCPSPPGLNFAFQWIPPGEFWMGAPEGEGDRTLERPRHRVKLTKPFCVAAYEVTENQWNIGSTGPSVETRPGEDRPKVMISWDSTYEFIHQLNEREPGANYRLLTEAEFEYVAGANGRAAFAFGDNAEELKIYGNFEGCDDGYANLAPIGSFAPNRFKLFDLHGNAQEWVADWFDLYPKDGSLQIDPQGAESGTGKVRKGGSYQTSAESCSVWNRADSKPSRRQNDLGFRIARSPVAKP